MKRLNRLNRLTDHPHLNAVVRLTFRNPASLIYLGLVLAATLFVTVDTLFVTHEDASFSGVWLFLLAAPTVFLFFFGSSLAGAEAGGPAWFLVLGLVVSVLVQSLALGWFVRLVRRAGSAGSAHPQGI
ncbi:SCO4225 family membrane protein [Streptomyces sp. NPDC091289]|uniref:SCO4225 family membrane protein n=1 Tax=Streptomyces sp. NPDC091289 TaxID=3365989 RepID=UPI0037F94A0B